MKDKLEVGMYVRTKRLMFQPPQIAKIKNLTKDSGYKNQYYIELDHNLIPDYKFHIYQEDILKTSYNIIDLIEVGDLMYIDISPDDCGGIVVPRVAETLEELEKWKERISSGRCILKDVLTKEQIINNWYEVSDDVKN